jgi:hypothetical protein
MGDENQPIPRLSSPTYVGDQVGDVLETERASRLILVNLE